MDIKIDNNRFRKHYGNLETLKESILEIGLLHPIIVDSDGNIIAGARRFKACQELGIEPEYKIFDLTGKKAKDAEVQENTERESFSAEEIYDINKYYNGLLSKQKEGTNQYTKKEGLPESGRPSEQPRDVVANTETAKPKPKKKKKHPRDVVADITGVSKDMLTKVNLIFGEENKDDELKKKVNDKKISVDKAAKEVRKKIAEREREQKAKEAEERLKNQKSESIEKRLFHGDFMDVFADIPDGSIDAIITDPPYPKEFIEEWSKLSKFAARVLKPGGFCIAYSGQLNIPEVIKRMSEHLDYYWMFSLKHAGTNQLIKPRNIFCGWKPILVYQNGFKKLNRQIEDVISGSGMEKDKHKWQQGKDELFPIIDAFTEPGDTVVEPFAGGGTTIVACIEMNRDWKACEIKKEHYLTTYERIHDLL